MNTEKYIFSVREITQSKSSVNSHNNTIFREDTQCVAYICEHLHRRQDVRNATKMKTSHWYIFHGPFIGQQCCYMKKSYLTCIWGRECEDFAESCLVYPPSSKAFLLCESFTFLSHPLVLFSMWISYYLWDGHCFWCSLERALWCSLERALSFTEKKIIKKKNRLSNKLVQCHLSNRKRQTWLIQLWHLIWIFLCMLFWKVLPLVKFEWERTKKR